MEKMYHVKRDQVVDVASIDMDCKKALVFDFISTDNFSWVKVPLSELVPVDYASYFEEDEENEENVHYQTCFEAIDYTERGWYSPTANQYFRNYDDALEAEMEIRGWA